MSELTRAARDFAEMATGIADPDQVDLVMQLRRAVNVLADAIDHLETGRAVDVVAAAIGRLAPKPYGGAREALATLAIGGGPEALEWAVDRALTNRADGIFDTDIDEHLQLLAVRERLDVPGSRWAR